MDDTLLDEIQQDTDIILSTSSFDDLPIEIPEFDTKFLEEPDDIDLISEPIYISDLEITFKNYTEMLNFIESNIITSNEYFILNIKLIKYKLVIVFREKYKLYDYFHNKFNLQKYRNAYISFYS